MPDAEFRQAGEGRAAVHALPYDGALLADAPGAPYRAQPPFGGHGGITEIAAAAPGQCSALPNTKAPLALTLNLNGYATTQFGERHEVPVWQTSPAGPFTAWPTGGGGFEYFYGFIGGENNQWIEKYKGKFAHGWDKQREITFRSWISSSSTWPARASTRMVSALREDDGTRRVRRFRRPLNT